MRSLTGECVFRVGSVRCLIIDGSYTSKQPNLITQWDVNMIRRACKSTLARSKSSVNMFQQLKAHSKQLTTIQRKRGVTRRAGENYMSARIYLHQVGRGTSRSKGFPGSQSPKRDKRSNGTWRPQKGAPSSTSANAPSIRVAANRVAAKWGRCVRTTPAK